MRGVVATGEFLDIGCCVGGGVFATALLEKGRFVVFLPAR